MWHIYIDYCIVPAWNFSDTGISTQAEEEEGEGEADDDITATESTKDLVTEQEDKKELEKKTPKKKKKKKKYDKFWSVFLNVEMALCMHL